MKVILLAKSNKRMNNKAYGKCVVGLTENGNWIRLVSDASGDSLPDKDCNAFERLDIIDVETEKYPLEYQPENEKLVRFNGKMGKMSIEDVIAKYGVNDDTHCFINNRNLLYENEMKKTNGSLLLLKAHNLKVYKDDRNIHKAAFEYNGIRYEDISMTAPEHYNRLFSYDNAFIVVSLPPDTGGYRGYYKFVAAIYPCKSNSR